jgi:hypothetical protein
MGNTPRAAGARGAYGLRLHGLEHPLLLDVEGDWPAIEVTARIGPGSTAEDVVGADAATIALTGGGEIALDRGAATARFTLPAEVDRDAIVHPYLAPVAAIFSHWLGRESLHGGAFAVDGAAWAVLGGRGAGKSSLLARLATDGHRIVADDLLVVDRENRAFAGPRSIDLRADAAAELAVGVRMGVLGQRERWRVELAPGPAALPLAGWVALGWGPAAATPIPAAERLRLLASQRSLRLEPSDPGALLRLAALPGWSLTRPTGWQSLGDAAHLLLDVAARGGPPGAA